MIERSNCPYCDVIVRFEFPDNYYQEVSEGENLPPIKCPSCCKDVLVSWLVRHDFIFKRVE